MERSRVGIVIPALNELATISRIVNAVKMYGIPIVVDDGSTDETAYEATQNGAHVISHAMNMGYDAALNSGFRIAAELNCDVIVTFDGDGQHDASNIKQFIAAIESGADLVIGIRNQKQRMAETLFALYARTRFKIIDPLCGMKAYKKALYDACGHFDSYKSIGTELAIFGVRNDFRMEQISITVKERDGNSRFGQALVGNYRIIRAMLLSIFQVQKVSGS